MLPTGNVGERYATFRHVRWSFGLQALMDSRAMFALHTLRNMQPLQFVVQKMGETEYGHTEHVDNDASGGIQYSLKPVGDAPIV